MRTVLVAVLATLVTWEDIAIPLRAAFQAGGEAFNAWVRKVEADSEQRLAEGERDHLVYYVLQSASFTGKEPIEPAVSARDYVKGNAIPDAVRLRMGDFLSSKANNWRLNYFRELSAGRRQFLEQEYKRAMRFLYEKEWASREHQGQARRDFVASLYQKRGHSTDTSVEASFAVDVGLEVLAGFGARASRVLVVGPGLDRSPRTRLREQSDPQSYQPYLLADGLLRHGIAGAGKLEIVCADLNSAVVDAINSFLHLPRLDLFWKPQDSEHREYYASLGHRIGEVSAGEEGVRILTIRPELAKRISAGRWNILTRKARREQPFDLVVATNVLLYFRREELALAMNNIHRLLAAGGYFLHNETRAEVEEFGATLGLPMVHARMVRLSAREQMELYDGVVLQRKKPEE
jgi:hypothetical protein